MSYNFLRNSPYTFPKLSQNTLIMMRRIITLSKKTDNILLFERNLPKVYKNHYLKNFENVAVLLKFLKLNTVHFLIMDECIAVNQFFLKVRKSYPHIRIIMVSDQTNMDCVNLSIEYKVAGVILDTKIEHDMNKAIDQIDLGTPFFSEELNAIILNKITQHRLKDTDNSSLEILTKREIEILLLILEELTNYEIAKKLFVSPRTIDTHRRNLLQKTKAKNTVGLVKFAFKNNLISKY